MLLRALEGWIALGCQVFYRAGGVKRQRITPGHTDKSGYHFSQPGCSQVHLKELVFIGDLV